MVLSALRSLSPPFQLLQRDYEARTMEPKDSRWLPVCAPEVINSPLKQLAMKYSQKDVSAIRGVDSGIRHIMKLSLHRQPFVDPGFNAPLFDKRCAHQLLIKPPQAKKSTKSKDLLERILEKHARKMGTLKEAEVFDEEQARARAVELMHTYTETEGLNFDCEPEVTDGEAVMVAAQWAKVRAKA